MDAIFDTFTETEVMKHKAKSDNLSFEDMDYLELRRIKGIKKKIIMKEKIWKQL